MTKSFSPSTAVEHAIVEGNYERVVELFADMRPSERAQQHADLRGILKIMRTVRFSFAPEKTALWCGELTSAQLRAAAAAAVFCGTAREIAEFYDNIDDVVAIARQYRPAGMEGLADALLERSLFLIRDVQRLIAEKLVERPTSDNYIIGLIGLPQRLGPKASLASYFSADPGLKDVLLRVMEVEGTSDCNLAAVDKYRKNQDSWSVILRRFCDEGAFTRAQLLDKTLSTLERDWIQFRSGWFSRFHDDLAPTVQEMRPHLRRYLALCHSRIPPTVSFALEALKVLDDVEPIPSGELAAALRPVLAAAVKAQVLAAIKLLDRVARRDPTIAAGLSGLAAPGLAHESADVQKAILQRMQQWGVSADLHTGLRSYLPTVAAINRPALQALIGLRSAGGSDVEPAVQSGAEQAVTRKGGAVAPLDSTRELTAIADVDELVERVAYVFENDTDIDEFERVLAALVRAAPLNDELKKRFAPIAKRAPKTRRPVARELARVVMAVFDGSTLPSVLSADGSGEVGSAERYLIARVDDAIRLALRGKGLAPLSSPTHRRGFICPAILVERAVAYEALGVEVSMLEQVQALLRLAPGTDEAVPGNLNSLGSSPFHAALRYALGDGDLPKGPAALLVAAARIRFPNADDNALQARIGNMGPDSASIARYSWRVTTSKSEKYTWHGLRVTTEEAPPDLDHDLIAVARHAPKDVEPDGLFPRWRFGGVDEGVIRYSATVLPSNLEAYFAEGANAIGNNLDWWAAQWSTRAYLDAMLDPSVPMTPMAVLLLALALSAKEPGQAALAIDTVVHATQQGRLNWQPLAETMGDLLAGGLTTCMRYAKNLRAVLRADGSLDREVCQVVAHVVEANSAAPPKDTALLLELLLETLITSRGSLADGTRKALERLDIGGKGKALRKSLLETA